MLDAAIQAQAVHEQIESKKEYVREQLIKMKECCAVCKLRITCDGSIATCIQKDKQHIAIIAMHILAPTTIIQNVKQDK